MLGRRNAATLLAEFLGAGILTLLVLSVQRSTIGVPFFVAIIGGLVYTVLTFAVGEVSGAHFNPALTIASWTARRITTVRAVTYIVAQMLGAWGAYWLYRYFVNNSLQPVGGHFTGHILVAEAVGTGVFAFAWISSRYQPLTPSARAAVSGLAYVAGVIAASSAAIGLLNPALALGVRAWVWGTYVLGPVVGAIIGLNLYTMLFADTEVLVAGETAAAVVTAKATTKRKNGRKK